MILVAAPSVREAIPARARILDIRPNPGRGVTRIALEAPPEVLVEVLILDAGGRLLCALPAQAASTPRREVIWDGRDASGVEVGSGVYFAHIAVGGDGARGPAGRILVIR